MKIPKRKIFLAVILCFLSPLAFASPGAENMSKCWAKDGSHVDIVSCQIKQLEQLERQLSDLYKAQINAAKKNDVEMKSAGSSMTNSEKYLAESQEKFLAYMESECHRAVDTMMGGTMGADIEISCKINLIRQRLERLK